MQQQYNPIVHYYPHYNVKLITIILQKVWKQNISINYVSFVRLHDNAKLFTFATFMQL